MSETVKLTFPAFFANTLEKHGNSNAMAFVGEEPKTYKEIDQQIHALIALFEKMQIVPGDRVAILSSNIPNWGITYFAVTFMGAVVVPLLPDFSTVEIENILEHSEAKAIFVSNGLKKKLDGINNDSLKFRLKIEDYSFLHGLELSSGFNPKSKPVQTYNVEEDDLAAIIYTSGTTGKSKGVMLSHKNISSNAIAARNVQFVDENDRFLSILPLSHTYENTLGLVLPMLSGACVYYLQKPPTPAVLLPALKKVKPTLMLSVPLIIEKIYNNKVKPSFEKGFISYLYKVPVIRKKLNLIAGKKLYETFGGHLKFFGVGGAKLDAVVEKFLIEAKFPYAIGYGLTETSPLLAGASPQQVRLQSTGPACQGVELKIHNPDPKTGQGEIWAKGPNVMKGYYKEPILTAEVITDDGWFKTGDLGNFDKDNFLFIRGRLKNMILSSSGENIYPEELESVINNFRHVVESIVVQKKGKLVALVHFNHEELEERYKHLRTEVTNIVEHKIEELLKELNDHVNANVSKFSRIHFFEVHRDPFKKTATHKIKRFLYS
ncbi:MAG: AMP-binding protein [Bacteroidales bacterium]|nr:AMP-binding protein [Bacteroidales bacterium]